MASLRFNYEGARRQERERRPLPFYAGRYYGYPPYLSPIPLFQGVKPQETPSPETDTEIRTEETPQIDATNNEETKPIIENISKPTTKPIAEEDNNNEKQKSTGNLSELVINRLSTAEAGLVNIRGQVDTAKVFFDDIIYKFESILQIMEIVRGNEERRAAGAQISTVSPKTNKDNIDEILELLQTPAMQSILRQFLLGVFTKKV